MPLPVLWQGGSNPPPVLRSEDDCVLVASSPDTPTKAIVPENCPLVVFIESSDRHPAEEEQESDDDVAREGSQQRHQSFLLSSFKGKPVQGFFSS